MYVYIKQEWMEGIRRDGMDEMEWDGIASLGIGFASDVLPSPPVEVCPAHNENKHKLPYPRNTKAAPKIFF